MSDTLIAPVVPASVDRPKRISKQLQRLYPNHSLSACQATTAHLFGHPDWFALDKAIKRGDTSAPDDRDLDDEHFFERSHAQMGIVCSELGDAIFAGDYPAPAVDESSFPPHMADFKTRIGHIEARLSMASKRWHTVFAEAVIYELQPTAAAPVNPPRDAQIDILAKHPREFVATLPLRLGRWWKHNLPHQPEVGDALLGFELDVDRHSSLLLFGRYWGTLCMHYAETISWGMAMGVAELLAQRFADISFSMDSDVMGLLARGTQLSADARAKVFREMQEQHDQSIVDFYYGFPRDDFFSMRQAQPKAFIKHAADVVKILDQPKSKWGTWDRFR